MTGGATVGAARRAPKWIIAMVTVALAATAMVACTTAGESNGPKGLWATLTADGFDVTWEPVAGVTGYELSYTDLGAMPQTEVSVTTTGASYGLAPAVEGHEYKFKVRALTPSLGEWSGTVYATFVVPVLPTIHLDTDGRAPIVSKDDYITGTFELDPGGGGAVVTVPTEVKGRGNTTWAALKKPYKVKLETSTPLMGMPTSKHWVLLADYFDPTHLRNQTAFEIGDLTNLAWTPRRRQVELVLNGVYQGVYLLTEHIRIDNDRVDIDEMTEDDISGDALTGGYLAEVDNQQPGPGDITFLSSRNQLINVKDPEPPTPEQLDYLRGYVNDFEGALYSPGFTDPVTGYAAYLDVASMVDYYLVEELIRNQDAFLGSTYFTKPRLTKLTMGPLWDHDNSMGNNRGWDPGDPTGWFVRRTGLKWISRLFTDPAFAAAVADRWDQLKPAFDQLPAQILTDGAAIATAMEHERWIWTYKDSPIDTPAELADWMQTRIDWIDANIHPT